MARQLTASQLRKRKWYLENRDKLNARSRERYNSDPDFREAKKQNASRRRASNPETIKVAQAEYRDANRSKINDGCRDWRKRNPVKVKLHSGNARARKRDACPSWLTESQKAQIENFTG